MPGNADWGDITGGEIRVHFCPFSGPFVFGEGEAIVAMSCLLRVKAFSFVVYFLVGKDLASERGREQSMVRREFLQWERVRFRFVEHGKLWMGLLMGCSYVRYVYVMVI